jgi:hypothetical protein
MPIGKSFNRHLIYMLSNGTPVLEWSEDLAQDLFTGEFIQCSKADLSHVIRDDELDILVRAGRVERYNDREVYIYALPEPPRRTLD